MQITKVIILEGADGSGKTTLANQLRDKLGYQIVKTGPPRPDENVFKSYTNSLLAAVESGQPTVIDRHYMGEAIYGPLLRGKDRLGLQGRDLIERLVSARGVTLVICAPPWSALVKGWKGKDDLLKRQEQLRKVNDAYLAEAERLGLMIYDWTAGENTLSLTAPPQLPEGVTGYHNADTLFIGERPGKKHVVWDLPFHTVGGSSKYLWEALQGIDCWREQRGAWVNAFSAAGRPTDLSLVVDSLLSVKRVIALGIIAYQETINQVVESTQVPHPAYWKRFHAHDVTGYQKTLTEVLTV